MSHQIIASRLNYSSVQTGNRFVDSISTLEGVVVVGMSDAMRVGHSKTLRFAHICSNYMKHFRTKTFYKATPKETTFT